MDFIKKSLDKSSFLGLYLLLHHAVLPLCWGRTSFFLFHFKCKLPCSRWEVTSAVRTLPGPQHLSVPRFTLKSPDTVAEQLGFLSGLDPSPFYRANHCREVREEENSGLHLIYSTSWFGVRPYSELCLTVVTTSFLYFIWSGERSGCCSIAMHPGSQSRDESAQPEIGWEAVQNWREHKGGGHTSGT